MADFVTCANNFDTPTIMRALYGRSLSLAGTPTNLTYFRIFKATRDSRVAPIVCVAGDTFNDMFRKCIHLSPDNQPSLRVCEETFEDGSGLTDAYTCAVGYTPSDVDMTLFCVTTDGEYAVLVANVTES